MSNNDPKRLVEYCLRVLGRKAYCEAELRSKLKNRTDDQAQIERVVQTLKGWNLLDDFEFAKNYIRNTLILKPKGTRLIKFELLRKGINREIVDNALRDQYTADQSEAIADLAKKKFSKLDGVSREKKYQKMVSFLVRRGFEYDKVKKEVIRIID